MKKMKKMTKMKRTKMVNSPSCRHAEMLKRGGWYCPVFDRAIDSKEEMETCNEYCDEYLGENDHDEE